MSLDGHEMTEAAAAQQKRRTLLVAVGATYVVVAAYTAPFTTLSQTAASLHTPPSGQAWILSSMSIGLAATLLASGAIADDYGRRRVLVAGGALLTLASIMVSLSTTTLVFAMARVLQGVGGAALTSCSLGLLGHVFSEPRERTRAMGLWSASLGAGIASGPLLAAGLDALWGWRAGHWLMAGISALVVVLAAVLLRESRSAQPRPIDYLGTALLALGLSTVLAGLVVGRSGWARPAPIGLLAAGAVLLVSFVASQAGRANAMLDLALFRRSDFVGATTGALATGLGAIALMSFVPTLIVRGLGYGPLTAALVLLCWSAVSVVSALYARRLPATGSARQQLALSLAGVALGQAGLWGVAPHSSVLRLVPGMIVAGIASGFLNAVLARQAVASVPVGCGAFGSGANNTARYVGAALGVTVVVVLAGRRDAAALIEGWNAAVVVTAGFSLVGAIAVSLCRWEALRGEGPTDERARAAAASSP